MVMLTRLTARLESVADGRCVLSTFGGAIGLEALVPGYLADRLLKHLEERSEELVTRATMVMLESPNQGATFLPRLLVFGDERERGFFNLLTTVKRLGPRKALKALAVEPGLVASWVVAGNTKSLSGLPEIGKSLAEAIVLELKGRRTSSRRGGMPVDPDRAGGGFGGAGGVWGSWFGCWWILESVVLRCCCRGCGGVGGVGSDRPEAERRVVLVVQRDSGLDSAEAIIAATFASR